MRLALVVVALLAVGCGDADHILAGPSAVIPPEPALSLTGHWGGAFSLTVQNQRLNAPVAMSLSHTGDAVAGWWSALAVTEGFFFAGQDVGGNVQGTINGSTFSGTVTWVSDEGQCTGSAALSGTITRGQLLFSAANIPLSGCQAPTALTWNVTPGRF